MEVMKQKLEVAFEVAIFFSNYKNLSFFHKKKIRKKFKKFIFTSHLTIQISGLLQ